MDGVRTGFRPWEPEPQKSRMKKQIVKTLIGKLSELKQQTLLDTLHGKSIAETKRRLLLRRFPRAQAHVPGR